MAEGGLTASEVGKEIHAHAKHAREERRDQWLSITEAVLLSVVALLAAYSGFGAAKWSTESRVKLAEATALRTQANRAELEAMALRNFDASTFNAWFSAYTARNEEAMALAERRFRPRFRRAFVAWRATNPESNPDAPRGPTYMPQYQQPGLATATALDRRAEETFATGSDAGATADDYIRATVFLAVVLFLVGISAHFPLAGGRIALIAIGLVLLILSVIQLVQLDRSP
jgi:hypothetical protein